MSLNPQHVNRLGRCGRFKRLVSSEPLPSPLSWRSAPEGAAPSSGPLLSSEVSSEAGGVTGGATPD